MNIKEIFNNKFYFRLAFQRVKRKLVRLIPFNSFYFSQKGYCPCCDNKTVFISTNSWLRDHFICAKCGSIPRERALMLAIEQYYPTWRDFIIHESSPLNRDTSIKLKKECKKYVGSQYFPDKELGSIVEGFRNEDLENQTFPDESFDLVITQDVMEHIYNPSHAFNEIARTLKPGGAHIFTVPIINKHNNTEVWATQNADGTPNFLKNPEWHGNPVNKQGSPVTMHWGFDIVDYIKETCDLETNIDYPDNLKYGIRAEYIEVLVTKKTDK